jgi:hypothetical protein
VIEGEDTQPDTSASGETEQVESADLSPENDDPGDSDERDESFEDTTLGTDE